MGLTDVIRNAGKRRLLEGPIKASKARTALGLALGLFLCACSKQRQRPYVSLSSVSPNGQFTAQLVELDVFIDRNFELHLIDHRRGNTNVIFRSPDEGLEGTEKIYWSDNSDHLLLTGRRFLLDSGLVTLTNRFGEQLYLLYHLSSEELKCNAGQWREKTNRFGFEDLSRIPALRSRQ